VPLMATTVPIGPDEGLNELMTGCAVRRIANNAAKKKRILFFMLVVKA